MDGEILRLNDCLHQIRYFTNFGPPIFSEWEISPLAVGPHAVEVPERLAILAHREKVAIPMGTDKAAFREWLLKM